MTEYEAIEQFKERLAIEEYRQQIPEYYEAMELAIKSLEEIQQYKVLEKRLSDMFGCNIPLSDVVNELERYLKEPDNPHPINARILTYEDADMWEAYKSIGTPEVCQTAVEKQKAKKPDFEGDGYADGHLVYDTWICPCCGKHYEVDYDDYDFCPNCGQKLDWSEED